MLDMTTLPEMSCAIAHELRCCYAVMQSRSVAPRSASEMRMAAAVAESTTAAAEAAKAAAQVQ